MSSAMRVLQGNDSDNLCFIFLKTSCWLFYEACYYEESEAYRAGRAFSAWYIFMNCTAVSRDSQTTPDWTMDDRFAL